MHQHPSRLPALPVPPLDILDRFQVRETFDTRFSNCARLLQSVWREQKGFSAGSFKPKKGRARKLGSRLAPEIARTGVNFLTPAIAKLVRREAAYREFGAMYDEERLWQNLLSSQPLTFNLLGQCKIDPEFGSKLLRRLFPDFVKTLNNVFFEHSPGRADPHYTNDHSAFDVLFDVTTANGKKGFIAIEIKFAESLRYTPRPMSARYDDIVKTANFYADASDNRLRTTPLEQMFRQHLLAYTMTGADGGYDTGLFVLISPSQNRDVQLAAKLYSSLLKETVKSAVPFRHLSLESVIDSIDVAGNSDLASGLRKRHVDYSPVAGLIEDWVPFQAA